MLEDSEMKSSILPVVIIIVLFVYKVNEVVEDDEEKKIRVAVDAISSLIKGLSTEYHTIKVVFNGKDYWR